MSWTCTGEPLGLGFDHRLERVMTQGALLLQVGADVAEFIARKDFAQERSISGRAFVGGSA